MNKSETGKLGEDIACEYLIKNGFKIVSRNVKQKWGEIDIIAKRKDGLLTFVEVKTMKDGPWLMPEENLTRSKLKKVQRTALLYVGSHPELIREEKGWRIDLVAITLFQKGDYRVNYYENISFD